LSRAVFVHRAPLFFVKEDAIFIFLLDEADNPAPHAPRVAVPKLGLWEIETAGDGADLIIGDANGTGKSATTAPAAQALKVKTIYVPEIISHEIADPARLRLTLFLERQSREKARDIQYSHANRMHPLSYIIYHILPTIKRTIEFLPFVLSIKDFYCNSTSNSCTKTELEGNLLGCA
jgi:hypothetical protein